MKTKDAIEKYGSKASLARALGIKAPSIANWGEDVPPLRVYQLRELEANGCDK